MTDDKKQDCYHCHGRGTTTVTETRQEPDYAMSMVMGDALGTGYFPQYKTVTETKTKSCTWCGGTGKR